MQSRRIFREAKGGQTRHCFRKISLIAEVLKKADKSLREFREVVHDKFVDILQPIRDIQYHGASNHHGFEDPFMRKKSA